MPAEWSNGVCSCFQDCSTCVMTYVCPCYIAGKNAEAMGENCVLHAIACYLPLVGMICRTKIRSKIRESKGIEGSSCVDCLNVTFCSLCTLVQEARELVDPGSQAMYRE